MPAVFGVTPDLISPLVLGLPIAVDTVPSTTQVTSWILTRDLIVQGVFIAKGVPVELEEDSSGYAYGHQAVLTAVASQVISSTQGQSKQAAVLKQEYLLAMKELKEWVHVLGKSVSSTNNVDKPTSSSNSTMTRKLDLKKRSRRSRMASSGVM